MITAEELRRLLDYDPETGVFIWKELPEFSTAAVVGGKAGCAWATGYRIVVLMSKRYLAHRLAWLYVYGKWPTKQLDHINRDKSDNRITNLREATTRENQLNTPAGKSGVKGVAWHTQHQKWSTQIWVKGRRVFLGLYNNVADAAAHYQWARISYDREFF